MDTLTTDSASIEDAETVCHKLGTNLQDGLNWNEVQRRLSFFGHNELNVKQEESILSKYLEQVCIPQFTCTHFD